MNTTSPKSRFAKFLDQFAIGVETAEGHMVYVRWHGNVGYVTLGDRTVARLELSEFGYQGHWSGMKVSVVDGMNGRVDECSFMFHDYFTQEDRVDDRVKDQPNAGFYAWSSNGGELGWYIAKPKNTEAFSSAVCEYLKTWQRHVPAG